MEGEHQYELRSRSRSRSQTPQVLNRNLLDAESPEHHYDLRSRSRDRSHTPGEVTSSRRSGSRSVTGSANKSHEKSMETIAEQAAEMETQVQQNENVKVTSKKVERRSERQRAKRQIFANGQTETRDNVTNDKVERQRKSVTPRRILTSDYSSEEGEREERDEREDPPSRPGSAYEIYKQAGDWWNVFPKTDYTYSQKSQCRYEIAPGVLAMPNMSRRSIHSDSNSTAGSIPSTSQQNLSQSSTQVISESTSEQNKESLSKDHSPMEESVFLRTRHPDSVARSLLYKTTHVENYNSRREIIYSDSGNSSPSESIRERYWSDFAGSTPHPLLYVNRLNQADSDTDIDDTITTVDSHRRLYAERQQREMSRFMRLLTTITTIITTSYTKAANFVGLGETRRWYSASTSYRQQHDSIWSKAWRSIDHSLQYLYLLLVNVLFLDSWLLSRVSNVRERVHSRRSKILWIILLPLLLLAGAYVTQKYTFPYLDPLYDAQSNIAKTTYRYVNDITNLTFVDYELLAKYVKNLQNVSLPSIPTPNISLPSLPNIGWNITWE